jgi:streptogramin lyase
MNAICISKAVKFLGSFVVASAILSYQNAAVAGFGSIFGLGNSGGLTSILELTPTGSVIPFDLPSPSQPISIQVDASDNIFALDYSSSTIKKITPSGTVSTFATIPSFRDNMGNIGGLSLSSRLAIAPDGTLYVSAQRNGLGLIYEVSSSGNVSTYASAPFDVSLSINSYSALAVSPDGTLVATRRTGSTTFSLDASGQLVSNFSQRNIIEAIRPPGSSSGGFGSIGSILGAGINFNTVFGSTLAVDASNNIYTTDIDGATRRPVITKITPQFGGGGFISGVFGSRLPISDLINGVFGSSIAIDPSGNVYTTDVNALGQSIIEQIDPNTGTYSTFFTQPSAPIVTPPPPPIDPNGNFVFQANNLAATRSTYTFSSLAFPVQPIASNATAVPEPFTIVGTLIGGTVALRLRKKLQNPDD